MGYNQQFRFNINQAAPTTPGTYRTWWRMSHNGQMFGPYLDIDATVPVLLQPSPNCNNPGGTSWVSPNPRAVSASCTGSGLLMQQVSSTKYEDIQNQPSLFGKKPLCPGSPQTSALDRQEYWQRSWRSVTIRITLPLLDP